MEESEIGEGGVYLPDPDLVFIDYANGDLTPKADGPAAAMSANGGPVGALVP